jgi:hypothetical protein
MGLKKVFNLHRLSGINSREVGSGKSSKTPDVKQNVDSRNDKKEVQSIVKSAEELAIVVIGESESVDSRFRIHTLPCATMDEYVTNNVYDGTVTGENGSSGDDLVLKVYEVIDGKTSKDDSSSNESVMGLSVDETTAFEVITVSSSKDYGSIFSGIAASDNGSVIKVENVSSEDSTMACGSIITKNEVIIAESDLSTSAVGPEIVLSKEDKLVKKHTLQRFFSVMTLLEGKGTSDETDRATASADANSLEEKSQNSSSSKTDDTADESESSSVAIALFDKNNSKNIRVKKSCVDPPSSTAANRDAKKKVVSMMIQKFKHIAGKGACLACEETNSTKEIVYGQPFADISGIFSRDVGDSESHISCAIDHDDTFTLDSMVDGNRMYM